MSLHVAERKKVKDLIKTDLDYDPEFQGVDDLEDHVFITTMVKGNAEIHIYWKKSEYEKFVQEGLNNLQELDRLEIEQALRKEAL